MENSFIPNQVNYFTWPIIIHPKQEVETDIKVQMLTEIDQNDFSYELTLFFRYQSMKNNNFKHFQAIMARWSVEI